MTASLHGNIPPPSLITSLAPDDVALLALALRLRDAPPSIVARAAAEACPTLTAGEAVIAVRDLADRLRRHADVEPLDRLAAALEADRLDEAA